MADLLQMRRYYESGITRSYAFRREQLMKFRDALRKYEKQFHEALYIDLKKSPEECWVTETGFLLAEINNAIRNLKRWMHADHVPTNLVNIPSSSFVMKEPLGVVLIISPWNYPLMLLLTPLVGAIAAGNCSIIKTSEFAPATAAVIRQLMEETFEKHYIQVAEGDGATVIPGMMNNFTFDHVFFTGGTAVGKQIYKMAAERLVPVTLELGGKSPCIVESDANINVAARRIAVTKFSNAGQMCVAPDYVLVHASKKEELIAALKRTIHDFFGDRPEDSYNYGKIINEKQFNRLINYLQQGTIIYGGRTDKDKLFIEPTVLDNVSMDSDVMKDEIFGPVLPIIPFSTKEEALKIIEQNKNPLAFYVFTSGRAKEKDWLNSVAFGGGCVNNSSWHLTNHHLPFGGRGFSGSGNCHGKYSFDTFSHKKAVMRTPTWFDPAIKYPPFKGKLKLFKWIIR
ncbi:MAG: aldehyde dehydrogenase family protein [Ferruginibacter sp.]|nr:aldehyde dehydrogenase family protein [Chitinophagaceae bacterium]MBP6287276.1 aldehyde dehydrogenase family protein [Ferruginibacter sp.]